MIKLSDYIVSFFEKENVKDVFMLSGGGCMHLIDSFGKSEKMRYWCMHHEQSISMAVDAYGRMKNDLAVAVVTCGPGATNTITGLLGAYQDSSPCVFISGQAKRKQTVFNSGIEGMRQIGQQEVNIIPIVQSITKYAVMINEPKDIRYHLEKAVYFARNGRPGPVWIDVPLDVQSSLIDESELKGFTPENDKFPNDLTKKMKELSADIQASKRPVIVAGQGVRIAGACSALEKFVSEYDIPVVSSFLGIDVLPSDHKCAIGRIGVKGTRAGNLTMQNADLLIAIGSRLSVSSMGFDDDVFAREAKVVVVDIDEIEHKKNTFHKDMLIISDAKVFIDTIAEDLANKLDKHVFREWLGKATSWKNRYPVCLPKYEDDSQGINYYKMLDLINNYTDSNNPVVSDAGSAFYVTSQSINLKDGERYIPSGALATMGFTLPASIGVAVANLNNTVIGITGDGSLQQNIQELQILKQYQLPVKLFVMNNNGYLSIRSSQRKFFQDHFVAEGPSSGVTFPDLSLIAKAYGLDFFSIDTIENAQVLLPKVFSDNKPTIIEVKTIEFQEIIPSSSSKILPDGSMKSMPLEDMYPFLDRTEFLDNMVIKPID